MAQRSETLREIDHHLREAWLGLTLMSVYNSNYHWAGKYDAIKKHLENIQREVHETAEEEDFSRMPTE